MNGSCCSFPTTANSVDEWLEAIQLGAYKENFRDVRLGQLRGFTNEEMKKLVPDAGRRRRLLLAIAALPSDMLASTTQAEVEEVAMAKAQPMHLHLPE